MMRKKTLFRLFPLMILLLACVLRLVSVTKTPPSLYWEEAALGYDAYSILMTGKDYHGNTLPILAFPSFGDFKPSLYFYAIVPFIKLFGLTPFAVRLPSVLSGIILTGLVMLIGKELFGKKIGYMAGLLYAIQPWSVHISRVGFETNLATLLITAGVWFLIKAREKQWYLLLAANAFGLSMYAYHSARIVAPILGGVLGLWVLYAVRKRKAFMLPLIAIGIGLLYTLPIFLNMKNPVIAQRAQETSIFSDIRIIEEVIEQRKWQGTH